MTSSNTPRIILGTMTFGLDSTKTDAIGALVKVRGRENVEPFFDNFHSHGLVEVDSARIYGLGDTETVMGQLPLDRFKLSTKVFPMGPRSHGYENLKKGITSSLESMKLKKIDIFYLHAPDYYTPFEETAKAINDIYQEGLFERFGLSNFSSWQVMQMYQICKQNGYVLPTVYQGMYNAICRSIELELLECLKTLNISFYAYNPLAAGFLSGKYDFHKNDETDRFDDKTMIGKVYRERYWNEVCFNAINALENKAKEHGLTLIETAWRWLSHHSGLDSNDGIIVGASSVAQLESNLVDLEKGPLPEDVVTAIDDAWDQVKGIAPVYFKNRATLKQLKKTN